MDGVKSLYPKMIHVTCLAHGLHRVAEFVRTSYPEVNRLIATGKSLFVKAPHRVERFQAMYPKLPLPPYPVLTRWGTWLNAAEYYNKFHDEFVSVIMSLNSDKSSSLNKCKELLDNVELKVNLCFIASKFITISKTIEHLETRGLSTDVISKINVLKDDLRHNYDKTYYEKLSEVLDKNKWYRIIQNVNYAVRKY